MQVGIGFSGREVLVSMHGWKCHQKDRNCQSFIYLTRHILRNVQQLQAVMYGEHGSKAMY